MAKRLTVTGAAIVVQDTITNKTEFDAPKSYVYYDVIALEERAVVKISHTDSDGFNKGVCSTFEIPLAGTVNNLGQQFTEAGIKSLFR
jgi:hypothetical protein